jgi:hypothetical protein
VLAWSLPLTEWTVPERVPLIGGESFSLNPGPFNIKVGHTWLSALVRVG